MNHHVVVVVVEVEEEEVEEDMDVVVVALDLTVTLQVMITHSLLLEALQTKLPLKEMMGGLQKDVAMVLGGLIVLVVVVEVSAMAKLAKKGVHEDLNAAVGQAAAMNLNVKALGVVTGEPLLMKLLR